MTARAALRLSPRQVAYHLRRKGRNTLARRFPEAYERRVDQVTRTVPRLDPAAIGEVGRSIARAVSPFYVDEYVDSIDDAARGTFTFFGQRVDFGGPAHVDWHRQIGAETDFHLWRMKLAHMGVLCPMLIVGDDRHLAAVSELVASYRARASFGTPGCFSSYWFPYSVSHRILALLSGYVLATEQGRVPDELRRDLEEFLAHNVGFLLDNVEHELKNNHVERNLAALVFYFSCVHEVPARLRRRLDDEVRRIIHACVLPDGLIAERSAMYQGLTVMALDVFARAELLSDDTRELARATHVRAAGAWRTMSHPDGEIALFNDSWFGEVPRVSALDLPGDGGPGLLPDAGYARLESTDVFVLMDAGPIGPTWNPGHGHADFLSIEADVDGKRFLVDPGTYQYSSGPRRAFERAARSHNGPAVPGIEPVEYVGCFRVGRMSRAEILEHASREDGGTTSGRLRLRDGTVLERHVEVSPGVISVVDTWDGSTGGAQVRLLVPGAWTRDSTGERLAFTDGRTRVELAVLEGLDPELGPGEWACDYLVSRAATAITLRPRCGAPTSARLAWELRSVGVRRGDDETVGVDR